jgi:HK97 family phage portal protein
MNKQSWWSKLFNKKSFSGTYYTYDPNGKRITISNNTSEYLKEGFGSNSTVYSIVKHISDKAASLPFILYKVNNKKELDRYKSMTSNFKHNSSLIEINRLRTKAMDEVDSHAFLDAFNGLGFEGKAQLFGFFDLCGEALLWKVKGLGDKVLEYRILPAQYMDHDSDLKSNQITKWRLNTGLTASFEPEEIAHWKRWNPFFDTNGGHLRGLSPLRAGFMDLLTSKAGKNAAYSDFSNNGVKGAIVRNEDIPWSAEQRDGINQYVDENFNGSGNRGKIRAINIKADWMQMGLSASEMETMKALQLTKEDLCNVFQFPPRLIAAVEGTFNNVEAAERQLITHCVLPRALSFRDFVNTQLLPDFKDGSQYFFDVDITALPEMQKDMKELAEILNSLPITKNEIREAMKYDSLPDENMNKVYIKTSEVPIDQANVSMDGIERDIEDLDNEGLKDYK